MSRIASVLKKLAIFPRTAADEDETPEIDIDDLKANAKSWAPDESVEVDFSTLVSMAKDAGTEMHLEAPESFHEAWNDQAYDAADAFLQHEGLPSDIDDPEVGDVRDAILDVMWENANHSLMFSDTVLLRDTDHETVEDGDISDTEDPVAAFKATELGQVASKYFSDAQIKFVVEQCVSFNAPIYLGVLTDDAVLPNWTLNPECSGTPVLVAHDAIDGSGGYEIGKGTHKAANIKSGEDFLNRLDYGNYSMGAVVGDNDWTWR